MSYNPDVLDLDALAPKPKVIKLSGQQYECKPLTIQQLIDLERLEIQLKQITSMEEVERLMKASLSEFVPAIKEQGLIFTIEQMWAIIRFAQATSMPSESEAGAAAAREYAPKKNESSVKGSPASSDSTPATK